MLFDLIMEYASKSLYFAGLLGGSIVLIFTSIGALPALLGNRITDKTLDIGLGFSGGVMIYVVSHEVIPETHRKGYEQYATIGFVLGFLLMLILDSLL